MQFSNLLISFISSNITDTNPENTVISETASNKPIKNQETEPKFLYKTEIPSKSLSAQSTEVYNKKHIQIDPEMEVDLVNGLDNIPRQTKMFETLPFVCRAHLTLPLSTIKSKEYRDSYLSKVNFYCSNQLGKEFEKCAEDMNWELLSLTKSIKNGELMSADPASYLFSTKEFLPDYCALEYNDKLAYLNYIKSDLDILSSEASASRLCTVYDNLC